MKFLLLVLAVVIAMVAAAPLSEDQYQFLFTRYVQQYNKQYETNDFFTRFNTFKSNLNKIIAHNASGQSWTMGVNKFADLSPVEFHKTLGFRSIKSNLRADPEGPQCDVQSACSFKANVQEIDWRAYKGDNFVNNVKDQGQCGSCWAFSAVQALESQTKIVTGVLPTLSEQQLVDCAGGDWGNGGCDGGLMDLAYAFYSKGSFPACSSQSYPYTGRDGKCQQDKCDKVVSVSGCTYTKPGVEGHVTQLQTGPIAVALSASFSMQFYSGGLFTDCSSKDLNHGVGLVGYLPSKFNSPAYIIRNSWGSSWGEKGYIYLDAAQGKDCLGMDTTAAVETLMGNSQPIVKA